MNVKCIIFDLDGTIVDSLEDLVNSMNFALQSLGMPEHTPQECLKMIGYGRHEFAKLALPPEKVDLAGQLLDTAWAHYQDNCCVLTKTYAKIPEIIENLYSRGISLAILTNKDQQTAEIIVRHYFGQNTFKKIVGATRTTAPKPEPDTILQMLEELGYSAEQTIFIGDSEVDIQTGKNANIYTVAVSWGFRSREILLKNSPDKIIDCPSEILDIVG